MYWVYYHDDEDLSGHGIENFDSERKALKFILDRINQRPEIRSLCDYTLIKGEYKEVRVKTVISELEAI